MTLGDLSWITSPSTFALAGLIAIALLVYRAIVRGQLVPEKTHDRIVTGLNERLAESRERENLWRDAHTDLSAAHQIAVREMENQRVVGETMLALIRALPPGGPR